jgi:dipeptidyl-peptidase-3
MLASSSPVTRLSSIQQHLTMNTQELKNFLADSPPSTVNLEIKKHFEALTDQQARYAHYISRQVKNSITMSQENPEH